MIHKLEPTTRAERLRDTLRGRAGSTYRRPTDFFYLVSGVLLLLATSLVLLASRGLFEDADINLFWLISALPDSGASLLWLLMQAGSLAAVPVVVGAALLGGRVLLARNLALGGGLAWFLNKGVQILVERGRPEELLEVVTIRDMHIVGLGFPSGHVTIASTLAMIAGPYLNKPLRWASWVLVALVAFARLYVGAHFPIDVLGGLALGVVIGALVNLLLGVPTEALSGVWVSQMLRAHRLAVTEVQPVADDLRASVPFYVRTEEGRNYFVKVLGTEHRNADFLFKVWRTALLKNVANSAPFLTPKQQVEHEAYLTMLARTHGVRTPEIAFTAKVNDTYALLVQERVPGQTLAQMESTAVSDALLAEVWRQVRRLHEARIAHGDLGLASILVDEDGEPWLIDFGFAEGGADDAVLCHDRAQMLASLAALVGADKAVASARASLGEEAIIAACSFLEPLALSSATRADLHDAPDLLDEVQRAIAEQTGAALPTDKTVLRIRPSSLVWVGGFGVGLYFLLPQVGELERIADLWRAIPLPWLLVALPIAALPYAMATLAQLSMLRERLPFVRTLVAHAAASFANRFGPQGLGGAVVMTHYLEKAGVRRRRAVTAFAAKTAAGSITHGVAALVVLSWVGIDDVRLFDTIQPWHVALALTVLLTVLLIALRAPERRRALLQSARRSLRELQVIMKQPAKAAQLLLGSVGFTAAYIAIFFLCLRAVGAQVGFLEMAAVFLAGEMLGVASPTPGGLGVLEGAMVAGLRAFAVPPDQAVAGVLLYRLLSFWLPMLPGFVAFRYLQRANYL